MTERENGNFYGSANNVKDDNASNITIGVENFSV